MKSLFKTVLILTLALSFGCSSNPERVEEEPVAENAEDAAPEEATPDDTTVVLVGVEWSVEDLAGAALVDDTEPTLIFGEDAEVTGNASCNSFFGTYESTDSELKITTAGTTRMACQQAVMKQEQTLMKTLNAVDSYEIDEDGVLTLRTGEKAVLTARR